MGNCLKIQSPTSWSTDDDDDDGGENEYENGLSRHPMYSQSVAAGARLAKMDEEGDEGGVNGETATHGEIKIRMTKKQLEKLVSLVGLEGLSIAEFLEKVTSVEIGKSQKRHRHWQPALQSIPEEA